MLDRERFISPVLRFLSEESRRSPFEARSEGIVKMLLEATKQHSLPVELGLILSERRIKKVEYGTDESGRLWRIRDKDGDYFVIRLGEDLSPEEERLTIAHEIGHTFFYTYNHKEGLIEDPPISLRAGTDLGRAQEHFCELFARELLMPKDLVAETSSKFPKPGDLDFSAELLTKLTAQFQVPIERMAQRLVEDLGIWRAIIFQLEKSPAGYPYPGQWSIKWVVPFETEEVMPKYEFSPVSLGPSAIALETISSLQRVFVADPADLLPADLEEALSESCQRLWQQVKKKKEVLLFTTSLPEHYPQLSLFKLDPNLNRDKYFYFGTGKVIFVIALIN